MPGATIYPGCVIGERVIVHSGAVIGSDGIRLCAPHRRKLVQDPADRGVVIGDDVRSALTPPSTAGADDTIIADG